MRDALLIALVIGGAYLFLQNRNTSVGGDRTLRRITQGFESGFNLAREGKSLYDDLLGNDTR